VRIEGKKIVLYIISKKVGDFFKFSGLLIIAELKFWNPKMRFKLSKAKVKYVFPNFVVFLKNLDTRP
jgi:hypothetical protein